MLPSSGTAATRWQAAPISQVPPVPAKATRAWRPAGGKAMSTAKLLTRLELLEQRVNVLETLPARVDALTDQIVQLRDEMHAEFSALRAEMRAGDEATRDLLRAEIQTGDEATRQLMRDLIQETRTHMLVLHEDLVERIKRLGEGPRGAGSAGGAGHGTTPRPRRRTPRG